MLSKTQSLIKIIKDLQNGALGRLNSSREECLEVLTRDKFCKSELPKIGAIDTVEIDSKFMEVDTVLADTTIGFGVKFTNIMEKRIVSEIQATEIENWRRKEDEERLHPERSNSHTEMNLKQKIDYFFPIVLVESGDLNYWQKNCKELLVTQDGNYLFACKLYSGI